MAQKYRREIVTNYLDKHPAATFTDFEADVHSGMTSSNFNLIRKKYRAEKGLFPLRTAANLKNPKCEEKRSYFRRKSFLKVYSRIWARSTVDMPKDTREAITDLVTELNRSGRTNWQIIELTIPPEIEIRELTKQ